MKLIDLTGQRFGRLTVLGREGTYRKSDGSTIATWRCRCDCGKETIVLASNLKGGFSKSCGCSRSEAARKNAVKARAALAAKRGIASAI